MARGWNRPNFCEAANIERPDCVRDIGEAFLDAGAEILVTNTDAANAMALAQRPELKDLTPERLAEICRRGAEIFRRSVNDFPSKDRYVFGAIGQVQQLVMLGEVSENDLADAYQNQAKSLADGGVDAILCRSFCELAALQTAVRAAHATGLPVIATMAFDCGPDQTETTLGVSVPQMCEALSSEGVAALGCDGGESPDSAARVVALLRKSTPDLPIWAAVSAGHPQLLDGRAVYTETPDAFAARAKALAAAGANFIGGRRGATPAHIAALAKTLRIPKRR